MPNFKKTNAMRQIEKRFPGQRIEEIVVKHINQLGSAEAAAQELGVSGVTLRRAWMPRMGIHVTKPTATLAGATSNSTQ